MLLLEFACTQIGKFQLHFSGNVQLAPKIQILKICGLVAAKSLQQCFHLKTLLSFQSMTSENLCEPSPILAPLGEILCEPRRLWRHGSRAPAVLCKLVVWGGVNVTRDLPLLWI